MIQFGFSLDRTLSDAMNPYLDSHQERCVLQDISSVKPDFEQRNDSAVIYFTMDLKNNVYVSFVYRLYLDTLLHLFYKFADINYI